MAIKRPIWRYGLFQIPMMFLVTFLVAGAIAHFLSLGCSPFWVVLFLGLSWMALMWVLVMPMDYLLQFMFSLQMSLAGRISILQAIAWTVFISIFLISSLPKIRVQCF